MLGVHAGGGLHTGEGGGSSYAYAYEHTSSVSSPFFATTMLPGCFL